MLYDKQIKKEREFSNFSSFKEKSKLKHLQISAAGVAKNNFFMTDGHTQNSLLGNESKDTGKSEGANSVNGKRKDNIKSSWVEYFAYYRKNGGRVFLRPENIVLNQESFVEDFMSERNNLDMWKQINHVTAILSERDDRIEEYRFRYIYEEHKDEPLFDHYQKYVMQLSDNYSYEQVLADRDLQHYASQVNTRTLCLMQSFKLAWFMSIIAGIHIDKMLIVFVRFNKHAYFIMDIRNIHWRLSDSSQLKRIVMQRIVVRDAEYAKQNLGKVISDAYLEDEIAVQNVKKKKAKLDAIYEDQKKNIDLDLYKKEPVDNRSDQAFALFHPGLESMNIRLSDLTDGNVEIEGIKKYFMNLYGTHSYVKKGRVTRPSQEAVTNTDAWNKKMQSRYRINSASAKQLQVREKKGDVYQSPFSPSIVTRKNTMLKVCTNQVRSRPTLDTCAVNNIFSLQFD